MKKNFPHVHFHSQGCTQIGNGENGTSREEEERDTGVDGILLPLDDVLQSLRRRTF